MRMKNENMSVVVNRFFFKSDIESRNVVLRKRDTGNLLIAITDESGKVLEVVRCSSFGVTINRK